MTYIAGYILYFVSARTGTGFLGFLTLNPGAILQGQVWRVVSWLLIPPSDLNIFTIVMLFCYYQLGSLLERTWGAFYYNIYIFLGIILTIVGAFLLYFIGGVGAQEAFVLYDAMGISPFTTYYISLGIFLGFAMTFPDQIMLFMFIIPIKIKYLAFADIIYLVYCMVQTTWFGRIVILCSLANVAIFFLITRGVKFHPGGRTKRQKEFQKAMGYGQAKRQSSRGAYSRPGGNPTGIARHQCAICGQTELTNPNLEFRFCSKCNGNYEYCQNHLFTHEHKK